MEAIITTFLSDPRLHVFAVVLLMMLFKCRVKRFFCSDLIQEIEWLKKDLEVVKEVQKVREQHYKEIPLMQMSIKYLQEGQSKSDERYNELDKKIDDLKNAVTELTTLVKQDLDNKKKQGD